MRHCKLSVLTMALATAGFSVVYTPKLAVAAETTPTQQQAQQAQDDTLKNDTHTNSNGLKLKAIAKV